jgi:hypothetical protein
LFAEVLDRMVTDSMATDHERTCGVRDQPAEQFAGGWIRMAIGRNRTTTWRP